MNATRKLARLDMVQSAKLLVFISEKFVEMKMTDEQFAEYATKQLGFRVIKNHVTNRRDAQQIPATRETLHAAKSATLESMFELVQTLEKRIAALETQARLPGV